MVAEASGCKQEDGVEAMDAVDGGRLLEVVVEAMDAGAGGRKQEDEGVMHVSRWRRSCCACCVNASSLSSCPW